MKEIPLTQGLVALVDDSDYERLSAYRWCAQPKGRRFYAVRNSSRRLSPRRTLFLHREILGLAPGDPRRPDHINGDGLDNRRANLRLVTHAENMMGFQRKRGGTTSLFRGVHWASSLQKWRASVRISGRTTQLGYFTDETEAAKAYDKAAIELFGEFASPNFPPG